MSNHRLVLEKAAADKRIFVPIPVSVVKGVLRELEEAEQKIKDLEANLFKQAVSESKG